MLVSLVEADGIPEGCLLSVRAGTTRRQASIGTDKPCQLSFPKPTTQANTLKVDLLAVLGSCSVDVFAARSTYPCEVKSNYGGDDMQITLRVQDELDVMRVSDCNNPYHNVDSPRNLQRPDDNAPQYILNVQSPSAVGAHAYLDSHDLLSWLHDVLQLLIRDRPADPWSYIDQSTARAKAASVQGNAPPHSTDPESHADIIPGNVVASTVIVRSPESVAPESAVDQNTAEALRSSDSVAPESAVDRNVAHTSADVIPGSVVASTMIHRLPEPVAPESTLDPNAADASRQVSELANFQPALTQQWQTKPSVGTWCSQRSPKLQVTHQQDQRATDKMLQASMMNDNGSDLREMVVGRVGSDLNQNVNCVGTEVSSSSNTGDIVAPGMGEKAYNIAPPDDATQRESFAGADTREEFWQTKASVGTYGGPLAARNTQEAWNSKEKFWQTRASVGTCGPPAAWNTRQQWRRQRTTGDDPWNTRDSFWHHRASVGTWCQPQPLRNTALFEMPEVSTSCSVIEPPLESGKDGAVSSEALAHSSQRNSRPSHAHSSSVPALPRLVTPPANHAEFANDHPCTSKESLHPSTPGQMCNSDMASSQSLPSLPMSSPLLGSEEKSSVAGASALPPSNSDRQSLPDGKRQQLSNDFLSQNERLRRENARLKRLRETRDTGVKLRSENEQLKNMLGKLRTVHIVPPVV